MIRSLVRQNKYILNSINNNKSFRQQSSICCVNGCKNCVYTVVESKKELNHQLFDNIHMLMADMEYNIKRNDMQQLKTTMIRNTKNIFDILEKYNPEYSQITFNIEEDRIELRRLNEI